MSTLKYLELFVTYYYIANSTPTNATSGFLGVVSGRAAADGRSDKGECGGKTKMPS